MGFGPLGVPEPLGGGDRAPHRQVQLSSSSNSSSSDSGSDAEAGEDQEPPATTLLPARGFPVTLSPPDGPALPQMLPLQRAAAAAPTSGGGQVGDSGSRLVVRSCCCIL